MDDPGLMLEAPAPVAERKPASPSPSASAAAFLASQNYPAPRRSDDLPPMDSIALPSAPLHNHTLSPPSVLPAAASAPSAVLTSSAPVRDGCLASISQSAGLRSFDNGAGVCVTCGRGGGAVTLHRWKHDSLVRRHCSSCILFYNKGMYCSQCFQVYRDASQVGDPSLWLTCCKCQRLSHLECVRNLGSSAGSLDCSLFTCKDCCNPSCCREGRLSNVLNGPFADMSESSLGVATGSGAVDTRTGPAQEASRFSQNSPVLDQEAVAAANIVAALAASEAKDAKAKAKVLAVAAVKAAARAKAALDAAYRAGRDEAKWRVEAFRNIAAVAGQHPVQLVGMLHSMVGAPLEKGQLEKTAVGVDYLPGQLSLVPANEEELATHMSNVVGVARSPRTAASIQRKRSLSSIAASEPMQPPLSSCGDVRQGGAMFKQQQQQQRSQIGAEVRQFRPLSSAFEVPYQRRDESPAVCLVGSEGLAVSGSPASMLDAAGTTRSCSMASHGDTVVGLPESRNVADNLCCSFLPGNGLYGSQMSVSVNDSGSFQRGNLATGGADPVPRQAIGSSMADTLGIVGKMANQANSEEMKTFSHTGEGSPNDLLNLGTSSQWTGEEEVKLSNGFVAVEQASAPLGFSRDSGCVGDERREKMAESVILTRSEEKACFGVVNHQLSPPEQPNGPRLEAGQGKQASDELLLSANKAFLQKNQRSLLLHMSASNNGEKPIPYSMVKGSVSTACSVPLQTSAFTSVPTGPQS